MLSFSYDYQYALGFCFLLQFTLFVPFPPPPLQGYVHTTPDSLSAATKGFCSHTRKTVAARRDFCDGSQRWSVAYRITVHTKLSCIACVQTLPPSLQEKSIFPEWRGVFCTQANLVWCEHSLRYSPSRPFFVSSRVPERCGLRDDTKNDFITGVAKFE